MARRRQVFSIEIEFAKPYSIFRASIGTHLSAGCNRSLITARVDYSPIGVKSSGRAFFLGPGDGE
jgi:hypothetical protein